MSEKMRVKLNNDMSFKLENVNLSTDEGRKEYIQFCKNAKHIPLSTLMEPFADYFANFIQHNYLYSEFKSDKFCDHIKNQIELHNIIIPLFGSFNLKKNWSKLLLARMLQDREITRFSTKELISSFDELQELYVPEEIDVKTSTLPQEHAKSKLITLENIELKDISKKSSLEMLEKHGYKIIDICIELLMNDLSLSLDKNNLLLLKEKLNQEVENGTIQEKLKTLFMPKIDEELLKFGIGNKLPNVSDKSKSEFEKLFDSNVSENVKEAFDTLQKMSESLQNKTDKNQSIDNSEKINNLLNQILVLKDDLSEKDFNFVTSIVDRFIKKAAQNKQSKKDALENKELFDLTLQQKVKFYMEALYFRAKHFFDDPVITEKSMDEAVAKLEKISSRYKNLKHQAWTKFLENAVSLKDPEIEKLNQKAKHATEQILKKDGNPVFRRWTPDPKKIYKTVSNNNNGKGSSNTKD